MPNRVRVEQSSLTANGALVPREGRAPSAALLANKIGGAQSPTAAELTVVIPTFNERGNIGALLARLDDSLADVAWEAVIVDDDSPDGTADLARTLARRRGNLRVLQRIGRRGLASACAEGMMASDAPYLAVLDADLQHDETLLPTMLETLRGQPVDLVVGSRYAEGGDAGAATPARRRLSALGSRLTRLVLETGLSDPLSGFFMVRASFFREGVRGLSNIGFKILLDLVLSAPRRPRLVELPYHFGVRRQGESKMSPLIALEYLELVADKLVGHVVPVRFIVFVMVGLLGVVVHLSVLGGLHVGLGLSFAPAQAAAVLAAMTANFTLNNRITYRDRRLWGRDLVVGLLTFYLACGIGALTNLQIANLLFQRGLPWAAAGFLGAVVGSVWNYGVTATFTWPQWIQPRARLTRRC